MKKLILYIALLCGLVSNAQQLPANPYAQYFANAYSANPGIPRGLLEAVAFTNTHFVHLTHNPNEPSCNDMPLAYSVMGLVEDGKGYFKNNLVAVSVYSGFSVADIKSSPEISILAYARAVSVIAALQNVVGNRPEDYYEVLYDLCELPDEQGGQAYAVSVAMYGIYSFLNNPANAKLYNFPIRAIGMVEIWGPDNLEVLSSSAVTVSEGTVVSKSGITFNPNFYTQSTDYTPAIWNAAASCNFSSRNGTAISAVTIHTVEGSYAGCISWFQNCNAQVSAHYVVRSSDGQITQMVLESDKAWHVGSENPYTIGIEHEGYVADASWYTMAMYSASAGLCRDICNSGYGISPLRTYYGPSCTGSSTNCQLGGCIKIKGHQHFANQTHNDPGPNWDWYTFYNLINNNTPVTTLTTANGSVYDSGGAGGNYSNDEQTLTLINPPNTQSITLTFTQFDVEANWDYLYVYDGGNVNAPLLGTYTGTSLPPAVTSTGASLLLRFRSDCATTAAGYAASYTSAPLADITRPTTLVIDNTVLHDTVYNSAFTDADNIGGSGLQMRFYNVSFYDSTHWRSNANRGFITDKFEVLDTNLWNAVTGTWALANGALVQSDESLSNTNICAAVNSSATECLYHWRGKIDGTGTNRRAGFHYFADSDTLANHGNSYFVWFRADQDEVQLYKVTDDVFDLTQSFPMALNTGQWYDFKVAYNHESGKTTVWIDDDLVGTWTDPTPLFTGQYVAFRSGNCVYTVDDFKVYKSRATSPSINIGRSTTNDIWRENTLQVSPIGSIASAVTDNANNISDIDTSGVNVSFKLYWTGAVSTDWNNPMNWSPNRVPTQINDAIIPDVSQQSNNFPLLDSGNNGIAYTLTLQPGATLTNANQKTITVLKTLTNKGTINAGADVVVGQ